jgi:hypothetical protein
MSYLTEWCRYDWRNSALQGCVWKIRTNKMVLMVEVMPVLRGSWW